MRRRILLACLTVTLLAGLARAQKSKTLFGEAWTGKVVTASDETHEITLKADDESKAETFVGVLEEGYKAKMKDGGRRELKVSELTPGMRVRVFYKTREQKVGGQKVKVQNIHRIEFLGIDKYTRLREALKIQGAVPVTTAESGGLPAADPLKIHLAIVQPYVEKDFVEWVSRWNKKEAAKYGSIELVADAAAADISLVLFWGADETVALLPTINYDQKYRELRDFFPATAHIVARDAGGLKVLWQMNTFLSREKFPGYEGRFEKEIETRMKARSKK